MVSRLCLFAGWRDIDDDAEDGNSVHLCEMTEVVLYEQRGDIGCVFFNQSTARNGHTFAMYEGLTETCARINKTREVKALVVTGAGDKAFAAGTDIAQFKAFKDGEDGIGYERKMD